MGFVDYKIDTTKVVAEITVKSKKAYEDIKTATALAGKNTEASAKGFAPVDTGRLQFSITYNFWYNSKEIHAAVTSPVLSPEGAPYGYFQEFGTRYIPGTPHLRPAFNANYLKWLSDLERV